MSFPKKAALLWELLQLARLVTANHDANWRMVINGGARQEIGQVHGHLIYDDAGSTVCSIALVDPNVQFGGWEHLFNQVEEAQRQPDNGYSLTFRLMEGGDVSATFTESRTA